MTPERPAPVLVAFFGVCTGVFLLAWWAAFAAGALPAPLVPLDTRAGHIAAEVVLGAALVCAGVLSARRVRPARSVLAAALGGLVYATLGALGDYVAVLPDRGAMVVLLGLTCVSAAAALVVTLLRED